MGANQIFERKLFYALLGGVTITFDGPSQQPEETKQQTSEANTRNLAPFPMQIADNVVGPQSSLLKFEKRDSYNEARISIPTKPMRSRYVHGFASIASSHSSRVATIARVIYHSATSSR